MRCSTGHQAGRRAAPRSVRPVYHFYDHHRPWGNSRGGRLSARARSAFRAVVAGPAGLEALSSSLSAARSGLPARPPAEAFSACLEYDSVSGARVASSRAQASAAAWSPSRLASPQRRWPRRPGCRIRSARSGRWRPRPARSAGGWLQLDRQAQARGRIAKAAAGAATRRSQASASCVPAPMAGPLTGGYHRDLVVPVTAASIAYSASRNVSP